MTELVNDPYYWKDRIDQVKRHGLPEHHAIFRCPTDRWLQIEEKHREILRTHISSDMSVLDVGCGWGRLLTLMPDDWRGEYLGIDISPDFIKDARTRHPSRRFLVHDLVRQGAVGGGMDIAILISIRPMICRNLGHDYWKAFERAVRASVDQILYLS